MPAKVRNWKNEYKTAMARGERDEHAARCRNRRAAEKVGKVKKGDGKDIDHKVPLAKGGSNKPSNLRVVPKSVNRSFKRNKDGSMK